MRAHMRNKLQSLWTLWTRLFLFTFLLFYYGQFLSIVDTSKTAVYSPYLVGGHQNRGSGGRHRGRCRQ